MLDDKELTTLGLSIDRHTERIAYLDYLRVVATFAVMILHTAAQNWYTMDAKSYEWNVFNFYDSIVRWCVPVFVMISGALFLKRKISIREIYSKYILRMECSFLFWAFIYALFIKEITSEQLIKTVLEGCFHMWFIPMIIGLYMCIPLIQSIIQKQENIKYFILLCLAFVFVFPQIAKMTNDFLPGGIQKYVSLLNGHVNNMSPKLVLGFTIYFILGYYLNSINLIKRQRGIIYFFGVMGFTSTIVFSAMTSIRWHTLNEYYYGYFTINVLLESIAVYVWFKYNVKRNRYFENIIVILSKYSFGAYLIHILILDQLKELTGFNTLTFNPAFSVPIIGVIVFGISFCCSALFNNFPILKKYVV